MKKNSLMLLLTVSLAILLMGCSLGKEKDDSGIVDSLGETQKIEVIAADSSDVIITISDDDDIGNFVDALKIEDWDSADIPSEATKGERFKMYQVDTIKQGESANNKDLNRVATMTSYKDVPYIEFSLKNFSLDFKVPEEVYEYLNSMQ